MQNVAIILAGGSGNRFGSETPKQFLSVAGKQIIEYSIDAFENCPLIDEIGIVCKAEYIAHVEALVRNNRYTKVKQIIPGGKERYDSTLAAIEAYPDDDTNLLFHDGVRPFVSERIIRDCIEALQQYNAVGVAVKTTDTIISVDADDCIDTILNRAVLRNVQTPQCFKRGLIKQAYDLALQDPHFTTTDDCGVIRRYMPEESVYMVNGEHTNIKITYPEDLLTLDRLIQQRKMTNTIL